MHTQQILILVQKYRRCVPTTHETGLDVSLDASLQRLLQYRVSRSRIHVTSCSYNWECYVNSMCYILLLLSCTLFDGCSGNSKITVLLLKSHVAKENCLKHSVTRIDTSDSVRSGQVRSTTYPLASLMQPTVESTHSSGFIYNLGP